MIYVFISVMLKIVFEDGQYHNEQIKLEFKINEICFESFVYFPASHGFSLSGADPEILNRGAKKLSGPELP